MSLTKEPAKKKYQPMSFQSRKGKKIGLKKIIKDSPCAQLDYHPVSAFKSLSSQRVIIILTLV